LAATFPTLASAQARVQGNYTALSNAFWQLTHLDPNQHFSENTSIPCEAAKISLTAACWQVNASLDLVDGTIIKKQPDYIKATVEDLIAPTENGQFPCTASWNGDPEGAPVVEVPASWLESTCPGWQLSDSRKRHESQWISPFVGF
jgi:hypothetical protein